MLSPGATLVLILSQMFVSLADMEPALDALCWAAMPSAGCFSWHLLRRAVCRHRTILLPRMTTEPSACRHRVKFWFIKNYMSPQMKSFVPHMAAAYGFEYQFVTYKWPSWLHKQVRHTGCCSEPVECAPTALLCTSGHLHAAPRKGQLYRTSVSMDANCVPSAT